MASDNDVGYGKPPKSGQFKKGKSGNPKGRKKGAQGLGTIMKEELNELVTVTQGGVKQSITPLQLALKALKARAAKGDTKAIGLLINLAREFLPVVDEPDVVSPTLSEKMKESLEFFEKIALGVGIDKVEFEQMVADVSLLPTVAEDDLE